MLVIAADILGIRGGSRPHHFGRFLSLVYPLAKTGKSGKKVLIKFKNQTRKKRSYEMNKKLNVCIAVLAAVVGLVALILALPGENVVAAPSSQSTADDVLAAGNESIVLGPVLDLGSGAHVELVNLSDSRVLAADYASDGTVTMSDLIVLNKTVTVQGVYTVTGNGARVKIASSWNGQQVIVCWSEYVAGTSGPGAVRCTHYNVGGTVLAPTVTFTPSVSTNLGGIALAYAGGNSWVVVYRHNQELDAVPVTVSAGIATVGSERSVSPAGAAGTASAVRMASRQVDGDTLIVAAYHSSRYYNDSCGVAECRRDVSVAWLDPSNAAVAHREDLLLAGFDQFPDVAIDGNGRVHVTWAHEDEVPGATWHISGTTYSSAGVHLRDWALTDVTNRHEMYPAVTESSVGINVTYRSITTQSNPLEDLSGLQMALVQRDGVVITESQTVVPEALFGANYPDVVALSNSCWLQGYSDDEETGNSYAHVRVACWEEQSLVYLPLILNGHQSQMQEQIECNISLAPTTRFETWWYVPKNQDIYATVHVTSTAEIEEIWWTVDMYRNLNVNTQTALVGNWSAGTYHTVRAYVIDSNGAETYCGIAFGVDP
ncbi:hypothetical protein JW710_02285 [Candidatus Dojkabacteria bacterium]|nr:hypothetical protein [Candidatus Dojkabacteria bacterium]